MDLGKGTDQAVNGYPQLPYVSLQQREPFGWWDRQERKNFNEVVSLLLSLVILGTDPTPDRSCIADM